MVGDSVTAGAWTWQPCVSGSSRGGKDRGDGKRAVAGGYVSSDHGYLSYLLGVISSAIGWGPVQK